MALIDTLESLAVSHNLGVIDILVVACVTKMNSITQLLEACKYFGIHILGWEEPIDNLKLSKVEKEYDGWRVCS